MQVVVHRVKVCQALARAQLLGHQLDPELQAGIHCASAHWCRIFHELVFKYNFHPHMISRVFLN